MRRRETGVRADELRRLGRDVAELVSRKKAIDEQLASLEQIIAGFEELGETQGIGAVRQRMAVLRREQAEIDREIDPRSSCSELSRPLWRLRIRSAD